MFNVIPVNAVAMVTFFCWSFWRTGQKLVRVALPDGYGGVMTAWAGVSSNSSTARQRRKPPRRLVAACGRPVIESSPREHRRRSPPSSVVLSPRIRPCRFPRVQGALFTHEKTQVVP